MFDMKVSALLKDRVHYKWNSKRQENSEEPGDVCAKNNKWHKKSYSGRT